MLQGRKRLTYPLIHATLIAASIWGFGSINQVYAGRLVAASSIVKSAKSMVRDGEVLHFFKTTYIRRDPTYTEPADPYHMPLLPFLRAQQVAETWISTQVVKEVIRLESNSGLTLKEYVVKPDKILSYYATEGEASVDALPPPIQSAETKERKSIDDVAWISGLHQSSWGQTAWEITFQAQTATAAQFASSSAFLSPSSVTPYAADLTFAETQWIQEIDQTSGLLVSMKWLALTQPEPTLLYSESYSQPEIVAAAGLTEAMDEFTTVDAEHLLSDIQANAKLAPVEVDKLVLGSTLTPAEVASNLKFSLYAPAQQIIASFPAKQHQGRLYVAPEHECHLHRPLSYDFDLCAGLGQTVRFEYTFWSADDYSDLQSINLLQGNATEVTALLKQSPPRWQSISPIKANIGGQLQEAWFTPALHGDSNVNALLFEKQGTFIQVSGYKTSEDQLIKFAESLSPLQSSNTNFTHHVYVPFVSH